MSARKSKRPGRTGRMRRLTCPGGCGVIVYASAGCIDKHGAPLCGECRQPLSMTYGADALAVSREAALRYVLDKHDERDADQAEALGEHGRQQERAAKRAERDNVSGFRTGAANCFVCGRFKSRPADTCAHCGDVPTTLGEDARTFNRAHGWAA